LPDLTVAAIERNPPIPSIAARNAFASHHGVSLERAAEELTAFIRYAMTEGGYVRLGSGGHLFNAIGYQVMLSPDGSTIVRYRTNHYERTPSEVLAGVKSRFGAGKRQPATERTIFGPPVAQEVLRQQINSNDVQIWPRAFGAFAKFAHLDKNDPEIEERLRQEFRKAASSGNWGSGNSEAFYVIECEDLTWIVASDTGAIVSVHRADDDS
jgi:hypothetical protein